MGKKVWVWDDKKQDYVKAKGASSSGKSKSVSNKNTVSSNSSKASTTNSTSEYEKWKSILEESNAEAAVSDIDRGTKQLTRYTKDVRDNIYTVGGGKNLITPKYGLEQLANEGNLYRSNLKSGAQFAGLSDDEVKNYLNLSLTDETEAKKYWNKARARTGDKTVLNGMPMSKEAKEYERLLNLYGRDQVDAALNKKTSQPSKANVSGLFDSPDAMTRWLEGQYEAGDDAFDKQMQSILAEKNTIGSRAEMYNNYSREDYRNDLNVIYSYNNPAKRGNITEDDYMRAMVRAQAATGQDFKSAVSNGLDVNWFKGALDAYDSGQKSMYEELKASGALDQDMSYEDYLDNMEAVNAQAAMQEKKQQRMNEWESTTSAKSAQIQGNEDYGAASAYRQDNSIGQLTPNADYLSGSKIYYDAEGNAMRPEEYRQAVIDSILNEYVAAGDDADARAALEGYSGLIPELQNYNLEAIPYMSDEQKSNFFYLYNTGDKNGARAYLEALDYGLQGQRYQDMASQYTADMQENTGNKVLGSIASVPRNLMNNLAGAGVWAANTLGLDTYADMHEFNPLFDYTTKAQIARGETGQAIANATDGFEILGTNIPQAIYNAGMSASDSAMNAFLFGRGGSVSMGSGAYMSGLQQNLMAGDDLAKAHQDASAQGLIEIGTEYVSIDKLLSDVGNPIKYFLQNALVEGSEEGASTILNTVYDNLVNGGESEINQRINELMTQGYTRNDAKWAAWVEWGKGLFGDVFTGVLSGGMSSGPRAAAIYASDASQGRTIAANETQQAILDIAGSLDLDPSVLQLVQEQQAALDAMKASQQEAETLPNREEAMPDGRESTLTPAEEQQQEAEKLPNREESQPDGRESTLTPANEQRQEAENLSERETTMPDGESTLTPASEENAPAAEEAGDVSEAAEDMAEAAEDAAENPAPKKGKKVKVPKVSNAKLGRIYREALAKLDERAQDVLRKSFETEISQQLQERGFKGDPRTTAEAISKMVSGDASMITPEVVMAVSSDRMVLEIVNDFTAPIRDFQRMAALGAGGIPAIAAKNVKGKYSTANGQRFVPERIVSISDDGKVRVTGKTVHGEVMTVDADSIDFGINDGGIEIVADVAGILGRNADALLNNMQGSQDPVKYALAFKAAMEYGQNGRSLSSAKSDTSLSTLTESQIEIAHSLGKDILEKGGRKPKKNISGISVGNVDTSAISGVKLSKQQKASINAMTWLAKVGGFNVKFVKSKADADGKYKTENGSWESSTMTLTLDIHAGSNETTDLNYAMMHTAGHELTHFIKDFADAGLWNDYQEFVMDHLYEKMSDAEIEERIKDHIKRAEKRGETMTRDGALEEVIADASGEALMNITEADLRQIAQSNPTLFGRIKQFFKKWLSDLKTNIDIAYSGNQNKTAETKAMHDVVDQLSEKWNKMLVNAAQNRNVASEATTMTAEEAIHIDAKTQRAIDNDQAVTADVEIKNSIRMDEQFGEEALRINQDNGFVSVVTLRKALADRKIIRDIFLDPANRDLLKLPPDIEGDTFVSDSSYGGTEENTTVCIRSMAAQALMDLISQNLGRPLTVQDTLLISQEIAGLTDRPECYYCYVATDRRAYRDFLGQYLEQRDAVIKKYKAGADRAALYEEFLGGRKSTANMKARFNMWLDAVDNGTDLIDGNDLASLENLFGEVDSLRNEILAAAAEVSGVDAGKLNIVNGKVRYAKSGKQITATTLKALMKSNPDMVDSINRYNQLTDATAYAQSASWAKKMKGYAAYNGHILNWSQKRVNDLNKHYGLRMYSFSDFSPAFILENMQMVTDASVRGLNMLGYTKEMPFAEIFAPSGMNINISTFAYEQGGEVKEDYKQGASWERAKALREKHPNVGIVMVATSDNILEWALQQDWVDVVIPYHLVRTGTDVAEYFGYKNYTGVSADGKGLSFAEKNKGKTKKERVTSVSPVEHRNDLISYVDALQRYGLTPRFASWLKGLDAYLAGEISPKQFRDMNPNYMKLVNETRRSYADTAPVQPKFDMSAAKEAIQQMIREGGYYTPVGGSMEAQFEIAGTVADKIRGNESEKRYSFRGIDEETGLAIYQSDYAEGTSRELKAKQVIELIQNVWSKQPLTLTIPGDNGGDKTITARFDPTPGERTDLSKIAYGNRHGTAKEKRITQNLSKDFRAIAAEAHYVRSKAAEPKPNNPAHDGVKLYHYFAAEILYAEHEARDLNSDILIPITMSIDVKETDDGDFFYSFHAEQGIKKESAQQTLHAAVAKDNLDNTFNKIVPRMKEEVNTDTGDSRLFQERDLSELSDRELLANAVESVAQNDTERDYIKRYKKHIAELNEKQLAMQEAEEQIRELKAEDAKGNRDEIIKLQNKVDIYAKQISRADAKLLDYEATKPIKDMLTREKAEYKRKRDARAKEQMARYRENQHQRTLDRIREVREAEANKRKAMRERADERQRKAVEHAREVGQRKVDRMKESQGKEKYRAQILQDAKKLYGWVVSPTNKGHVPEMLKRPLGEFLESIDFSSARSLKGGEATRNDRRMIKALDDLRRALSNVHDQESLDKGAVHVAGYVDLPSDYLRELDALVGKIEATLDMADKVTDTPFMLMTSEQLHEMSKMFRILNTSISKMNTVHENAMYESNRTMSGHTIDDMTSMTAKLKTNKHLAKLNSLFNWKNATPYYAFQRLGRGGKAIFDGFQNGWDKMAQNSKKLIEYAEDAFTSQQAKAWSKDIKTIELDSGEKFQMTASQAMSLYCLSKRDQAIGHLMGGGIRISDIDMGNGNTLSQVNNYILSEKDISRIIGTLTAEQKAVADKLQKFLNTVCSDWGNEISMKRFGYKMFTEEFYFPIETDANNRSRIDDKQEGKTSMFRLLNMSAMKQLTPNANNAIIIRDIFDVFSNHATDIAKYNAMALPILDFIKWYNYVEKSAVLDANGKPTGQITTRSVQKALEHAYGQDAKQYMLQFIRDINGEHDGGRNDDVINKLTNRAKTAAVGANLRVYLLQLTSLPRAAYAINPVYLARSAAKIKNYAPGKLIKGGDAQNDIGILKWKNLGFYSTDINNSVRDMVRRDQNVLDKVREWQMAPAGWMDNITGNIIYEAVKLEMADKHPNLKPGTEAYKGMLNKRVREIVYKTQVVDSTMTRSELMRSKGIISAATAFMSEPTLTVNMLNESLQEAIMKKRGAKLDPSDLSPGKKAGRAVAVFLVSATVTSIVGALADAFRDDDDYEEFEKKYLDALKKNAIDNVNIFGMIPIIKEVSDVAGKIIKGQDYKPNTLAVQVLTSASNTASAIKDWNEGKGTLANAIFNALKTASYGSGVGVYNAVRDLTAIYNTVFANKLDMAKVQTYEDRKETIGATFYEALSMGDAEKLADIQKRMEINGVTLDDIAGYVTSSIKADFIAGSITEDTATEYLMEYADKKRDDAATAISGWKYERDTGFKYSEMKTDYQMGVISKTDMIKYLQKYSGKDAEGAAVQVNKWKYEVDTGDSYSDIRDDYLEGNITEAQLRGYLASVEGLDEEDVDSRVSNYDYSAYTGKTTNAPKYWRLAYTYETGGDYKAYADQLFDEIMNGGEKKKSWKQARSSLASSLASYYKKDYLAIKGTPEGDAMLEEILDVYEAIGYSRSYEREYIDEKWKLDD